MTISKRLQLLIRKGNHSQKDFSELIGISPNVLNNYVKGRRNPSLDVLQRILKFTYCNLNWLLTGEGDMYLNKENNKAESLGSSLVKRGAGLRLRRIRKDMKLTQVEFSQKFSVSRKQLSKYETDLNRLPDILLDSLHRFGINLNWLLTGEGDMYLNKENNKAESLGSSSYTKDATAHSETPATGERLKSLREELNMAQKDFAENFAVKKGAGLRLRKIRKNMRLTQVGFSREFPISQKQLSRCEADLSRMPDILLDSLHRFGINLNWLLTGEGSMFLEEETERTDLPNAGECSFNAKTAEIPLLGQISCGEPSDVPLWEGETVKIPSSFIKGRLEDYHVLIANGRSMEPAVKHGDFLLLKLCGDFAEAENKVVAVRTDGAFTLKKFEVHHESQVSILKPFNSDYKDIILNEETDDIKLIGILQALIRVF